MTTPTSDQSIIDMRRARVSQLKLRGLSSREIALALANGDKDGNGRIVSPRTGRPYDHMTILADLKVLRAEWKEERLMNTDAHADRQLAEIQEIKRAGWAKNDPELALKGIDREIKILGTAKPLEININFSIEIVARLATLIEAHGENPDQWFHEMIQDFEQADSEEVQTAQEIINAHSHAG